MVAPVMVALAALAISAPGERARRLDGWTFAWMLPAAGAQLLMHESAHALVPALRLDRQLEVSFKPDVRSRTFATTRWNNDGPAVYDGLATAMPKLLDLALIHHLGHLKRNAKSPWTRGLFSGAAGHGARRLPPGDAPHLARAVPAGTTPGTSRAGWRPPGCTWGAGDARRDRRPRRSAPRSPSGPHGSRRQPAIAERRGGGPFKCTISNKRQEGGDELRRRVVLRRAPAGRPGRARDGGTARANAGGRTPRVVRPRGPDGRAVAAAPRQPAGDSGRRCGDGAPRVLERPPRGRAGRMHPGRAGLPRRVLLPTGPTGPAALRSRRALSWRAPATARALA